ncbi:MAG: hypothetical protein WA317_10550 [Mycobacterium sp.]|uniref:hypothetical protein n=1 Tax=Mycobacterium sp. TaxID=1785 RepID=UPI003CC5AFE4
MNSSRETVRRGLLLDGLGKLVDLNAVDWHVKHQNPSASPSEVQHETLEVIRSLVSDGLFRLGGVHSEGEHLGGVVPAGSERFDPWDRLLDHSIRTISHVYVKHYDDPERWMYSAWLQLSDKGEQLARSIEEKDIEGYR